MKIVKLTKGYEMVIDDEDYERVTQFSWCVAVGPNGIPRARKGTSKKCSHTEIGRFLLNPPKGLLVDHIDRNPLNNQKSNLRIVTKLQNNQNSSKRRRGTSQYKGVMWHKRDKVWEVQLQVEYKCIYVGRFEDEKEAARAYDQAVIKHHGAYGAINGI